MLATLASAAAAPPLAPPGAADAPTLDLYVGDERRTTITTNFGTATEALWRVSTFLQGMQAPKSLKSSVWKRVEPSGCVCEASLPKDNDTARTFELAVRH